MADYKDLVGGILNRARDAAQDAGITGVIEKGAQRAKSFGNATKLTLDLGRDHRELERVFAESGKLCYEQASGLGEGAFAPLFAQATALREAIAVKEAEIEAYKAGAQQADPAAAAAAAEAEKALDGRIDDFEAIVNQTENDGSAL